MIRWKISENGALLIYILLLTLIVGVLVAWRMLPSQASKIEIIGINGEVIKQFNVSVDGGNLRYTINEDRLKVYSGGAVIVFPMVSVKYINIQP